jgi:hypothetical protein
MGDPYPGRCPGLHYFAPSGLGDTDGDAMNHARLQPSRGRGTVGGGISGQTSRLAAPGGSGIVRALSHMSNATPAAVPERFWKGFLPSMAVLALVLAFLFREGFAPGVAHFSNDGPLGVLMSQSMQTPEIFTGCWSDLSWLGDNGGANRILPTYFLLALLGPIGFAKFYPPLTLFFLGACAWIFFRTIRLSAGLCCVAALAAALNVNYFSNSCWGVGTRAMTLGMAFLALAALMNRRCGNRWLNAALAGLAVGIGVIEGADNGAIFSLFIAGFVVLQSFIEETTLARRLVSSLRVAVVAVFALFVAGGTVGSLLHLGTRTKAASAAAAAPLK